MESDTALSDGSLVNNANSVSAPTERRVLSRRTRYGLRAVLWDVSTIDRVCGCGRWRRGDVQAIELCKRPDGGAYFHGVQSCGSVWACPVCAAKIRQRRAEEIRKGLLRHLANGGGVVTQVLTLPHDQGDRLKPLFDAVRDGWRRVQGGRRWLRVKAELGIVGTIRSTEITHGSSGFHPHLHILYLTDRPLTAIEIAKLESHAFHAWSNLVEKRGFRRPMQRWCRVERVRNASEVSDYLCKVASESGWDMPLEMTRHDLKEGRRDESRGDNRSPFQILRDFADTGDCSDLAIWQEYEQVTKGRTSLFWSRGLKQLLGVQEKDDEELAEETQDGGVVALVAFSEWKVLSRNARVLCELLEAAERGDPAEVQVLIRERVERLGGYL